MATASTQGRQVRALFKAILKMHRAMPSELRGMGDQYVKDEFKRHKNVTPEQAQMFMNEWTGYYLTMAKQLHQRTTMGIPLTPQQLDTFDDQQIGQLHELLKETQKPIDPDNPLGYNPHVSSNKEKS